MPLSDSSPITLRPVSADDEEFLYVVYAGSRSEELAHLNWDEPQFEAFLRMQFTAQSQHYRQYYPQARHEIIMLDGHPVGRLYVNRSEREMRILDISILAAHRRCGIGAALLKALLAEAEAASQPVTVYVESFNPSRSIFERLGFAVVEEHGVHHLMQWRPSK
ncbi:MAG: GNAT family N-acetyltransferase [Blastocatellales bacterium]